MNAVVKIAGISSIVAMASAQSLTGTWNATVKVNDLDIPFKIEIATKGGSAQATFFNGDERFPSTSGTFSNKTLVVKWEYFAATLTATYKDGFLEGVYDRARSKPYPFHAPLPENMRQDGAPDIGGVWEIHDVGGSKGEKAWRLIVKQEKSNVQAAILRIDGDTGTLTGSYRGGKFVTSHFSGMRPALLEITPAGGALKLVLNGKEMIAIRPADARAKGLPEPDDPSKHTGVKDAKEPFHFNFPDLTGKMVSDRDARFRNKVVLVNISGSWCPNCHDEAPVLEEMYRKYRAQGLEIVALSFEEADQLKDPTRLRAFIARYGLDYTILLGGTSDEAADKLTQAEHWDAWPTTFFLGRDGRVREVHSGFPSRASGDLFTQAKREFAEEIEKLLAESALSERR
jgi:peroxiredoxin